MIYMGWANGAAVRRASGAVELGDAVMMWFQDCSTKLQNVFHPCRETTRFLRYSLII